MRTELFDYVLPHELIAQRPTEERDGANLLVVEQGGLTHQRIKDWPELVPEGALLVLNDSKVIKSRIICKKSSGGGRVELLFLEPASEQKPSSGEAWLAIGHANRPLHEGTELVIGDARLCVAERLDQGVLKIVTHHPAGVFGLLEQFGQMPLPPYVERAADAQDEQRYQTVFAKHQGSVAAPTAGLHLTHAMLQRLQARNIGIVQVTLHVGMGTFRPVSAPDLNQHVMHAELFEVSEDVAERIAATHRQGNSVVAVGTTVVRALESAAQNGEVRATRGTTRLLIQPGHRFKVVDALLTNFHAPKSTLLALVCAFAGVSVIQAAYREAVERHYRFLSYGDAMWLPRRIAAETEHAG